MAAVIPGALATGAQQKKKKKKKKKTKKKWPRNNVGCLVL
jgi:hypothetical protein